MLYILAKFSFSFVMLKNAYAQTREYLLALLKYIHIQYNATNLLKRLINKGVQIE